KRVQMQFLAVSRGMHMTKQTPTTAEWNGPATLVVRILGPFEMSLNGAPASPWRTRASQWLLSMLVLRHDRDTDRGWLATTLWPDSEDAQARYNLRRALSDLRRVLGPEARRLLSPTPRTVRIDLSDADCDLIDFDASVCNGDPESLE